MNAENLIAFNREHFSTWKTICQPFVLQFLFHKLANSPNPPLTNSGKWYILYIEMNKGVHFDAELAICVKMSAFIFSRKVGNRYEQ